MEPIFTQQQAVEGIYVGPDGKASLWAMIRFAMNAAGKHSSQLSFDWDTMAEKGMFWAVIRHRMQIYRYPEAGEIVTVETWPLPTTRSAYPRAVVATDAQGNTLFRMVSLWVLIDIQQRKMILPGKSGIEVDGFLRGDELEPPASILPQELKNLTLRTVTQDDLDRNGHMNNARYLVWAQEVLPPELRRTTSEFEICYLSEARLGQEIALHWELDGEGILHLEGVRADKDDPSKTKRVFAVKMRF